MLFLAAFYYLIIIFNVVLRKINCGIRQILLAFYTTLAKFLMLVSVAFYKI